MPLNATFEGDYTEIKNGPKTGLKSIMTSSTMS